MIRFEESRMTFEFDNPNLSVIKFDEATFFDKHFKKLQGSKGIDFLLYNNDKNEFFLIEVKNFRGSEHEPGTRKRLKMGSTESVTYETALKVRDTISCIVGAIRSMQETVISNFEKIIKEHYPIKVILLLEAPNSKDADYKKMTDDLKKQLSWLNVKTLVLNKEDLQKSISGLVIKNLPSV